MRFPNPAFSPDTRNKRKIEILIASSRSSVKVTQNVLLNIKFLSPNLENYKLTPNAMLKFHTLNELERLQSIIQPDFVMLLSVIENVNSIPKLIELLVVHIQCVSRCDIEHLSDFILQDIKEILNRLHLSKTQLKAFGKSIRRSFSKAKLSYHDILDDWFSSYRDNSRLGIAKRDAFSHLSNWHLSSEQLTYFPSWRRDYLLEESCSDLTHALLYVPVDRLKEGLKTAVQKGVVNMNDDLCDFIYDRTHVPME